MQHNPTSRASRNLIVRLAQTLKGNTALFDDVFVDPLHPQLLNRKAFDRIMEDEDLKALVWSVTYADADGLKALNDSEGHEVGDAFLQEIVEVWTLATRAWDRADSLMFRLGGDEFAVLWFQDGGAGPKRLQDAWDVRFAHDDTQGVTCAWGQVDASLTLAEVLEETEANVREAKAGRARTEVEALRARVAELETQVECEQREQDRLRREVERRTEQRDIERSLCRDAERDLRESEEARERLRDRLAEAESIVAAQAQALGSK